MSSQSTPWWVDDLEGVCVQFQLDLSCMIDGELDEVAAARAISHLETCSACVAFFDDARNQVKAHRILAAPEALLASYKQLIGGSAAAEVETIELVHRLSTIFYQLGKAYVLTACDPDFRTRVFEKAVALGKAQVEGRGFVDGVLARGKGGVGGVDWQDARHLLNGRLTKIESPLEKGRRLLQETLAIDPTHEETRLYLAFLDARDGKKIRAANQYRQIFRSAVEPANRAHAAIQLGNLFAEEGEFKKAIACSRWVCASGLADEDDRFFFVRFNIGMYYADLSKQARSLAAFRTLLDRHPGRRAEIAELFMRSPLTRTVIDGLPGFAQALLATCPELFSATNSNGTSSSPMEE
jgi:tetratricopeptide (TPR) repeat protein